MKAYRFTAQWCQPCKQLSKTLEQLGVQIPVYDVDSEEGEKLVRELGIKSVPTIVIEGPDGQIEKYTGAVLSPILKDRLVEYYS